MKLNIADIKLFESLIDFDVEGQYVDLHNDYLCIKIEYEEEEGLLRLIFYNNIHSNYIELRFECVFFSKQVVPNFEIGKEGVRLDNMYRGRFEIKQKLYELTDSFCGYIYIDFLNGTNLEFYAKTLSIDLL